MQEIKNILNKFETIQLNQVSKVSFMHRRDTKYLLTQSDLHKVLNELQNEYQVLNIKNQSSQTYRSLYFDTPNFDFYSAHHRGKLNRYKIRYRNYVESEIGFFEVKVKNNKGETIKERIKMLEQPELNSQAIVDFLKPYSTLNSLVLKPVIWINYKRISLVNKAQTERISIDYDLEFCYDSKQKQVNKLLIIEIKKDNRHTSPLGNCLKSLKIKETSFSKYCVGMTYLYPELKRNNFKQQLIHLTNLTHDASPITASGN